MKVAQHRGVEHARHGVVGTDFHGKAQVRCRIVELPLLRQHHAQALVGLWMARMSYERAAPGFNRVGGIAKPQIGIAEVVVGISPVRSDVGGGGEVEERFLDAVGVHHRVRQIELGDGVNESPGGS
jgi:hypothetical protein